MGGRRRQIRTGHSSRPAAAAVVVLAAPQPTMPLRPRQVVVGRCSTLRLAMVFLWGADSKGYRCRRPSLLPQLLLLLLLLSVPEAAAAGLQGEVQW